MKISSLSKEIWSNIDDKYLFPVAANGGTYRICDSYISKYYKEYLIGTIKHGDELNLIIFIEQYYEIIISHNNQYNKWEGTFCLNLWHWHILKLRNNITLFHEPILNPSGNCDCITVITATNINITYK